MDKLQIIKNIKFFDSFSKEDLDAIVNFIEVKNYSRGQLIVDLNEVNTSLYFLLKGSVLVSLHEKPISKISTFGEIFGEMSISGAKSSFAKIICDERSSLLVFNFLGIHELSARNRDYLEKLVYKSFAEVLAKRLNKANLTIENLKKAS